MHQPQRLDPYKKPSMHDRYVRLANNLSWPPSLYASMFLLIVLALAVNDLLAAQS